LETHKNAVEQPDSLVDAPDVAQLEEWLAEGGAEATDGCWVEPDGTCEHGCLSWLLVLALI
jgi:hypothetical protein